MAEKLDLHGNDRDEVPFQHIQAEIDDQGLQVELMPNEVFSEPQIHPTQSYSGPYLSFSFPKDEDPGGEIIYATRLVLDFQTIETGILPIFPPLLGICQDFKLIHEESGGPGGVEGLGRGLQMENVLEKDRCGDKIVECSGCRKQGVQ